MKTILLLAGRSRRFWPLHEKSLFPLCGKTLVEHQVERLKSAGCTDITLVVGAHNKKEIKKLFPRMAIVEQKKLGDGMQGACLAALPKIKKGQVLIVSGNDVIDPSAFADLKKRAQEKGVDGAILARKVKRYFPGGYLTLKGGRVIDIVEKPRIEDVGALHAKPRLVNIVAHIHNDAPSLLAALKKVKNHRDDGYESALQSLFAEKTYKAVPYEGIWQPVKYPWHLLPLMEILLKEAKKSISRSAKIHPTAVIGDDVTIEDGVRVFPNAVIHGPAYIGRNAIIGNNALVRGSSIGEGCVIGFNTEVKGSLLAGSVWTHMTYLGDSVIGKNVSFGGGCMTGNLRLDEGEILSHDPFNGKDVATGLTKLGLITGDDCRFGIQMGSNPGVKVGAGSFVSSGCLLESDVPEKSFVRIKDGSLSVRPNKMNVGSMEDREKYRKTI